MIYLSSLLLILLLRIDCDGLCLGDAIRWGRVVRFGRGMGVWGGAFFVSGLGARRIRGWSGFARSWCRFSFLQGLFLIFAILVMYALMGYL